MSELTKAQIARMAIRTFRTTADAMCLRGFYKPSGRSGQQLINALNVLSPEIYGSMNDSRVVELKGLEYVIDRLPRGIEQCTRIVLTARDEFEGTTFEKIIPARRRRISFRVSEKEMCFIITTGLSEVYDLLTHLTFLEQEACKIRDRVMAGGQICAEWERFRQDSENIHDLTGSDLDQALWNLSKLLGRPYGETKETFEYFESAQSEKNSCSGLFEIIYWLGKRLLNEQRGDEALGISFTPQLRDLVAYHEYGRNWAVNVKTRMLELGLHGRPVHVISANMHSVRNLLYGSAAVCGANGQVPPEDIYDCAVSWRDQDEAIETYASAHGFHTIIDTAGTHIDCQVIDCAKLADVNLHPALGLNLHRAKEQQAVLLVLNYAFGTQAFEVMDELLTPLEDNGTKAAFAFRSISIMGKAGILPGNKGDIMLATAHVLEGDPHNYLVDNALSDKDFDGSVDVYTGPMVTVLGTSLQNRDILEKFLHSSWQAVGLEMEGAHYQRAVCAAIIRNHIPDDVRVIYAYYASDNPLVSGQTLASGEMGDHGVKPTYMVTKAILEKIFNKFE